MVPAQGAWNSSVLNAYAYVPLTDIRLGLGGKPHGLGGLPGFGKKK